MPTERQKQAIERQQQAIEAFRSLHRSGCFVLPNPWDRGTALLLQGLGFEALATTSAGLSFGRGVPDAIGAVSLQDTLEHIGQIVEATPLPVHADFQHGFADDPEELGPHVALCVDAGVAGLSIEDATGDPDAPLYPKDLAIARIEAARQAIDAKGLPVHLTGRCEAFLVGHDEPLQVALTRLVAYAEAGADCLYAPGVRDPKQIAALVQAVAPKPLNVLMSSPHPDLHVGRLQELGVRRISVGSAMARVALGAFLQSARSILQHQHFDGLSNAASFAELNALFEDASRDKSSP